MGSIPVAGWVILAVVFVAIIAICAWKWWKDYKKGEIEITDYKKKDRPTLENKKDFTLGDGREGVVVFRKDGTVRLTPSRGLFFLILSNHGQSFKKGRVRVVMRSDEIRERIEKSYAKYQWIKEQREVFENSQKRDMRTIPTPRI